MNLLTKEIRAKLPAIYEQAWKGDKAIVHLKFFTPDANWTWYVLEGSPVINSETGGEIDFEFFGLVKGQFTELGYFTLKQLESIHGPTRLPVERDRYWKPTPLGKVKEMQ